MTHILVVVGTIAVGLLAAGLAIFMATPRERERSYRHQPSYHAPSPPPYHAPSPPPHQSPNPPPHQSPNPPPHQSPNPPPHQSPSPPPHQSPSPPSSPNPSLQQASAPPNVIPNQTSNENNSPNSLPDTISNSPEPVASSLHEDESDSESTASYNDNPCYHASECTNCENNEVDLVTFFPCQGSFLCRVCAMQYLEKNEHCPLCRRRVVGTI